MRIDMAVLYTAYNWHMHFSTFFFDLDETLYPHGSGLWQAVAGRINLYLTERMGFPPDEVVTIREKYFREYGTTLRGLQAHHQVDLEDYLAFVHDVPLHAFLSPDPELRKVIGAIPARKYIFTNADSHHARRVLDVIGLQGVFDGIIDVHTMAPHCKPMPEAFTLALKAAGSPDPQNCVLLDDQRRITRAARALGMYTVLVGAENGDGDSDAALLHLNQLPELLENRN